jgi:hypothetical protein
VWILVVYFGSSFVSSFGSSFRFFGSFVGRSLVGSSGGSSLWRGAFRFVGGFVCDVSVLLCSSWCRLCGVGAWFAVGR